MRFEFSVAFRYLLPKKRRLSSSVMSLFSIGVIASVVWLATVFLSIMEKTEKKWVHDALIIGAAIKVVPSSHYFNSYYYQIDSVSEDSNFSYKNLKEKLATPLVDPFNPDCDEELPEDFPVPDKNLFSETRDLAKEAHRVLVQHLSQRGDVKPCQVSFGDLRITLDRQGFGEDKFVGQTSYAFPFQSLDTSLWGAIEKLQDHDIDFLVKEYQLGSKASTTKDQQAICHHLFQDRDFDLNPVILPLHFAQSGVVVGDRGCFSFHIADFGSFREQSLPICVVGFYNPGLSPLGGRSVLMSPQGFLKLANNAAFVEGIFEEALDIHLKNRSLKNISKEKKRIKEIFDQNDLSRFWEIKAFYDYPEIKPFLSQLRLEKVLFSVVAVMVLAVAASNIVAMLMLMVHQKRKEIGIMYALGVSKKSVKLIFGLCGFLTGSVGAILGGSLAWITLVNFNKLMTYISFLQGLDLMQISMFETACFSLSGSVVFFLIMGATVVLASLASLLPLRTVSRMNLTELLNCE